MAEQLRLVVPEGTADPAPKFPRLAESAHRTYTPVYAPDWAAIAAAENQRVEIPEIHRQAYAEAVTLRQFYEDPVYGLQVVRLQRVAQGTLAANTRAKDVQALNRWERFSPRPSEWPAGRPWLGRPLAFITDKHATATVAAMLAALSRESCRSTWSHLRVILNHAVQVKAIAQVPEPKWPRSDGADRQAKELYTDDQLAEIYGALAKSQDLQTAFVVSVNVGPRTVDLFLLRWENFALAHERPVVDFTARKTGKRQIVPLAPFTVRQLRLWRRASGVLIEQGLLWPHLTDQGKEDPERSRPARKRNRRFKQLLATLGIIFHKPWQVGRLTCNERLERHCPGSGQFVLGHASTLNSVSYREPSGLIYEAVTTLPQPFTLVEEG